MGLEFVELIVAIEQEFGIAIPDEEAPKLAVVGTLFDYVMLTLRQRGESPDEGLTWDRFRAIFVRQLGVRPDEVVRSAHIVRDLRVD